MLLVKYMLIGGYAVSYYGYPRARLYKKDGVFTVTEDIAAEKPEIVEQLKKYIPKISPHL